MDQADSLRDLVQQRAANRPPLRVIAVTSGKGGVGKTHIACNLAVLAARTGRRVLVLDADLGLANADIVLGVAPHHHLGHLLEGSGTLEDVLAEGPEGIRILAASTGVQELTALDDAQKLRLVSALDAIEDRFDLVLVDCGAGIGDNVLFFAGAAQEALLVISAEPTSPHRRLRGGEGAVAAGRRGPLLGGGEPGAHRGPRARRLREAHPA